MSFKFPSSFDFDLDTTFDGSVDLSLPTDYGISIRQLPTINIDVAPLEIRPIEMSFRLKEVPSLRVHFPVDYKVCFGLFGLEIASVHFCGQAQVITEPYVPNPCEQRLTRLVQEVPAPQPNADNVPR